MNAPIFQQIEKHFAASPLKSYFAAKPISIDAKQPHVSATIRKACVLFEAFEYDGVFFDIHAEALDTGWMVQSVTPAGHDIELYDLLSQEQITAMGYALDDATVQQ